MSLLDRKELQFTYFNDKRVGEEYTLLFHERNPAGRGLDFDDLQEIKQDFVRYAVKLRCLNPVMDTNKTPLPPLEYLAEAITDLQQHGLRHNKEPRKELEKILQTEGASKEWFPEQHGPCTQDMRINTHLGARGVMTPGRIQDPEGAKIVIISFKTTARAITTIHKQTY